MGAKVYGISIDPPTKPSHFELLKIQDKISHFYLDIRHKANLSKLFVELEPDFVFHLAAQPLVKEAYSKPCLTYETNFIGTMNVLESLRLIKKNCIIF